MKKTALITGASTGIGRATAIEMAKNGYQTLAGVRNERDRQSLLDEKIEGLEPIILDITQAEHIQQLAADLSKRLKNEGLAALVNNAGINYIMPFELSDEQKVRQLMEVNFFGMVNLSKALLPLLQQYGKKDPKGAKIINVGSIGSAIGIPWEFSYHASKFAVLGMSQSLRFELEALNIKVVCVMPGGVRTPFFRKSGEETQAAKGLIQGENAEYYAKNVSQMWDNALNFERFATAPEKVAMWIRRAIEQQNPRLRLVIGLDAKIINLLVWMGWTGLLKGQFVKR
jgi:NAD(P)-dependent dehydrogenase (short-subunit alcohol dehydrogenase family)